MVTQLLLEIDQVATTCPLTNNLNKSITIIAATNKLEYIDRSFLQPGMQLFIVFPFSYNVGRFEKVVFVDVPHRKSRQYLLVRFAPWPPSFHSQ